MDWLWSNIISFFNITFFWEFLSGIIYVHVCRQILFICLCHLSWFRPLYTPIPTGIFHFLFIFQLFIHMWMVQNRWWEFWFVCCDMMWLMVEAGLLCLLFVCTLCLKNIKIFDSQGFLLHILLCDIKFFIACLKILASPLAQTWLSRDYSCNVCKLLRMLDAPVLILSPSLQVTAYGYNKTFTLQYEDHTMWKVLMFHTWQVLWSTNRLVWVGLDNSHVHSVARHTSM